MIQYYSTVIHIEQPDTITIDDSLIDSDTIISGDSLEIFDTYFLCDSFLDSDTMTNSDSFFLYETMLWND